MICYRRASVCSHECDNNLTLLKCRDSHRRCRTEARSQLNSNPMVRGGQWIVDVCVRAFNCGDQVLMPPWFITGFCIRTQSVTHFHGYFMLLHNEMKKWGNLFDELLVHKVFESSLFLFMLVNCKYTGIHKLLFKEYGDRYGDLLLFILFILFSHLDSGHIRHIVESIKCPETLNRNVAVSARSLTALPSWQSSRANPHFSDHIIKVLLFQR